jgi:hypothetical protein
MIEGNGKSSLRRPKLSTKRSSALRRRKNASLEVIAQFKINGCYLGNDCHCKLC